MNESLNLLDSHKLGAGPNIMISQHSAINTSYIPMYIHCQIESYLWSKKNHKTMTLLEGVNFIKTITQNWAFFSTWRIPRFVIRISTMDLDRWILESESPRSTNCQGSFLQIPPGRKSHHSTCFAPCSVGIVQNAEIRDFRVHEGIPFLFKRPTKQMWEVRSVLNLTIDLVDGCWL